MKFKPKDIMSIFSKADDFFMMLYENGYLIWVIVGAVLFLFLILFFV